MRASSIDRVGAAAAIGLHLLAGAALVAYEPARSALPAAAPIMVSLVTAPRVETKAELDTVTAASVDLVQGYLFAKPAREFALVA